MPFADPIGVDERYIAQWSPRMTRYLRPIIMSAMLALTLATAACTNSNGSSSGSSGTGSSSDDQRSKGDSDTPFGGSQNPDR